MPGGLVDRPLDDAGLQQRGVEAVDRVREVGLGGGGPQPGVDADEQQPHVGAEQVGHERAAVGLQLGLGEAGHGEEPATSAELGGTGPAATVPWSCEHILGPLLALALLPRPAAATTRAPATARTTRPRPASADRQRRRPRGRSSSPRSRSSPSRPSAARSRRRRRCWTASGRGRVRRAVRGRADGRAGSRRRSRRADVPDGQTLVGAVVSIGCDAARRRSPSSTDRLDGRRRSPPGKVRRRQAVPGAGRRPSPWSRSTSAAVVAAAVQRPPVLHADARRRWSAARRRTAR